MSVGALFCLGGIFFLTLALWFALATVYAPHHAALIMAGGYFGIGLIFVGLASRRSVRVPIDPVVPGVTAAPLLGPTLLQAFIVGVQAGARTRGTRPL